MRTAIFIGCLIVANSIFNLAVTVKPELMPPSPYFVGGLLILFIVADLFELVDDRR